MHPSIAVTQKKKAAGIAARGQIHPGMEETTGKQGSGSAARETRRGVADDLFHDSHVHRAVRDNEDEKGDGGQGGHGGLLFNGLESRVNPNPILAARPGIPSQKFPQSCLHYLYARKQFSCMQLTRRSPCPVSPNRSSVRWSSRWCS